MRGWLEWDAGGYRILGDGGEEEEENIKSSKLLSTKIFVHTMVKAYSIEVLVDAAKEKAVDGAVDVVGGKKVSVSESKSGMKAESEDILGALLMGHERDVGKNNCENLDACLYMKVFDEDSFFDWPYPTLQVIIWSKENLLQWYLCEQRVMSW